MFRDRLIIEWLCVCGVCYFLGRGVKSEIN